MAKYGDFKTGGRYFPVNPTVITTSENSDNDPLVDPTRPRSLQDERGETSAQESANFVPEISRSDIGVYTPPPEVTKGVSGRDLPKLNSGVQSVYDIRPINAKDFIVSGIADANGFDFTVPQGYTAVLREFSYQLGTWTLATRAFLPNNGTYFDTIAFTINGIDSGLFLPITTNGAVFYPPGISDKKIHIIAEAGSIINFSFFVLGAFQVAVLLYGQLLLNSGLPKAYEIGSHSQE